MLEWRDSSTSRAEAPAEPRQREAGGHEVAAQVAGRGPGLDGWAPVVFGGERCQCRRGLQHGVVAQPAPDDLILAVLKSYRIFKAASSPEQALASIPSRSRYAILLDNLWRSDTGAGSTHDPARDAGEWSSA